MFCLSPWHIIYSVPHPSCAFLYSGSFFEGRDKTKPIKGDEEIAWSRVERTGDNAFSEGQSEIAEELSVLQNKITWNKFQENTSGACWVCCCLPQTTFNETLFFWWDVTCSGSWEVYLRTLRWPHSRLKSHTRFGVVDSERFSCVCAQAPRRVRLFVTLWTAAPQAPLSMGFSRQEYWRGLPFPPPGDLPSIGIELWTLVSCIGRQVLYHWAAWELFIWDVNKNTAAGWWCLVPLTTHSFLVCISFIFYWPNNANKSNMNIKG